MSKLIGLKGEATVKVTEENTALALGSGTGNHVFLSLLSFDLITQTSTTADDPNLTLTHKNSKSFWNAGDDRAYRTSRVCLFERKVTRW